MFFFKAYLDKQPLVGETLDYTGWLGNSTMEKEWTFSKLRWATLSSSSSSINLLMASRIVGYALGL